VRVFLDTSILVSALAARGLCADLFQALIAAHTVVVSETVLDELQGVLSAKFRFPQRLVDDTLAYLHDACEVAPGVRGVPFAGLDAADRAVLAGAIAAKVAAFVTGDQAILALRDAEGIPLLSPRGLWERLREE